MRFNFLEFARRSFLAYAMCLVAATTIAFLPVYAESSDSERDQADKTNALMNALSIRWGPTLAASAAAAIQNNVDTYQFMTDYAIALTNGETPKPRSYGGVAEAPGGALVRDFGLNMSSEPFWQCLGISYEGMCKKLSWSGLKLGFKLRFRMPIQQVESAAMWQSDYFPKFVFDAMESLKGMEKSWYPVARVFAPLDIYLTSQLTPIQQSIHEIISGTEEAELEGLSEIPDKRPPESVLKEHSQRSRLASATSTRSPRLEYRVHPTLLLLIYIVAQYILEYYAPVIADLLKRISGLDKRIPILSSEIPPFIYFSRNPYLQAIFGIQDQGFLLKYALVFLGYPGICVGHGDTFTSLALDPLYPALVGPILGSVNQILHGFNSVNLDEVCIPNWGRIYPMDTHPLKSDHTTISGVNALKGINMGRQLQKLIGGDSGGGGGGTYNNSLYGIVGGFLNSTAGSDSGSAVPSQPDNYYQSESSSTQTSSTSSSGEGEEEDNIYWGFYDYVVADDRMQWTYGSGIDKNRCYAAGELSTPLANGTDGGELKDGGNRSITHWKSLVTGCIWVWPPESIISGLGGSGNGSSGIEYDTESIVRGVYDLLGQVTQ